VVHILGGALLGALKLHVLNPMAHSGFTGDFIAGADTIPNPNAHNWGGVDFFEQDGQTIIEVMDIQ
jgi:hypothetical protein